MAKRERAMQGRPNCNRILAFTAVPMFSALAALSRAIRQIKICQPAILLNLLFSLPASAQIIGIQGGVTPKVPLVSLDPVDGSFATLSKLPFGCFSSPFAAFDASTHHYFMIGVNLTRDGCGNNNYLMTIDANTGAIISQVPYNVSTFVQEPQFDPSSGLIVGMASGTTTNVSFVSLDPSTASTTTLGSLPLACYAWSAFDSSTHRYFAIGVNATSDSTCGDKYNITTIDANTGAVVSRVTYPGPPVQNPQFDPSSGQIVGVQGGILPNVPFVAINPSSGKVKTLAPLPVGCFGGGWSAFDAPTHHYFMIGEPLVSESPPTCGKPSYLLNIDADTGSVKTNPPYGGFLPANPQYVQGNGIDLSSGDVADKSWQQVIAANIRYVAVDAWGGLRRKKRAQNQLLGAQENGISTAAYALLTYFSPGRGGAEQIDQAILAAGTGTGPLKFVAVDVEVCCGEAIPSKSVLDVSGRIERITDAVAEVQSLGFKAIIYTDRVSWHDITGDCNADTCPTLIALPLWDIERVMHYGEDGKLHCGDGSSILGLSRKYERGKVGKVIAFKPYPPVKGWAKRSGNQYDLGLEPKQGSAPSDIFAALMQDRARDQPPAGCTGNTAFNINIDSDSFDSELFQ